MTPTLKQLEALHWTAKLGSFQAAALRLNATQSAISKRIVELETMFGVPLFAKTYRRSKLTPDGMKLAAAAEEMLALSQRLVASMADPRSYQGSVRIGASELVALTWLPRLVEAIRDHHPAVTLDLEVDLGLRLLHKLESGLLDIAFIPGPAWGRKFKATALKAVSMQWAVGPRFDIRRGTLTLEQLSAYPMLVHHPQAVSTELYDGWLRHAGFNARRAFATNSLSVMAQLTRSGLGVAKLPAEYFREDFKAGALRKVQTDPALPRQQYYAVQLAEPGSPLVDRIGALAVETCDFRHSAAQGAVPALR